MTPLKPKDPRIQILRLTSSPCQKVLPCFDIFVWASHPFSRKMLTTLAIINYNFNNVNRVWTQTDPGPGPVRFRARVSDWSDWTWRARFRVRPKCPGPGPDVEHHKTE